MRLRPSQRLAVLQGQQAQSSHGHEREAIPEGGLHQRGMTRAKEGDGAGGLGAPTLSSVLEYSAPAEDRAHHRHGLPAPGRDDGEVPLRVPDSFVRSAEGVQAALAGHVGHLVLVGQPWRAAAAPGVGDAPPPSPQH
jgi:hypothetical protein